MGRALLLCYNLSLWFCFIKETLDALTKAESINDDIKTQLNDLCRFSKDLSTYSAKVSQLFKEYNR